MSKEMSKERTSAAGCGTKPQTKSSDGKDKKKKKHFFKGVEKKPKEAKTSLPLPPKDALEFSANWKTLVGILSSEKAAKTKQSSEGNQVSSTAKRPRLAVRKDQTAAQGPGKDSGKAGARTQRNVAGPSQPQKPRAEKKRALDGGGRAEKRTNEAKTVEEEEKKPTEADIWFDDVDPDDIEAAVGAEAADIVRQRSSVKKNVDPNADAKRAARKAARKKAHLEFVERALIKERAFEGLTRAVAIDCEMVGVGPNGTESTLARVSIVNQFGKCVYDKYVRPAEHVTDFRTAVSGIRPSHIKKGKDFKEVQQEVAQILEGRILVGHAIHNDLKILLLDHPKRLIRDTQKYRPYKKIARSVRPALKVLCKEVLNVYVQQGQHSSVQDAQATMRLYTLVKKEWEAELKAKRAQSKDPKRPRTPRAKVDMGTAKTQTGLDQ